MSQSAKTPPALLVNGASAQKSKLWGDAAKNRFIKQHGSVEEIPEGDAHAVPIYNSPVQPPPVSPEEQQAAEKKLEEQINALKNPQTPSKNVTPLPPEPKGNNFYDEWID